MGEHPVALTAVCVKIIKGHINQRVVVGKTIVFVARLCDDSACDSALSISLFLEHATDKTIIKRYVQIKLFIYHDDFRWQIYKIERNYSLPKP